VRKYDIPRHLDRNGHYYHRTVNNPIAFEAYRKKRAEKLKELYEKLEPEYKMKTVYIYKTDQRRNITELWETKEAVSPFDLPDFEELMPKIDDEFIDNRFNECEVNGDEVDDDDLT
jgi:hypothetical protein